MNIDEIKEMYNSNKDNFIFTLNEIKYLKSYESEYGAKLIKDNSIDGAKLIKCYENQINNFKKDIGAKKIVQKEFSSILYKFIFQVTGNETEFEELIITHDLKKRGYFYVIPQKKIGDGENCIYSIKNGFNFDFMKREDDSVMML